MCGTRCIYLHQLGDSIGTLWAARADKAGGGGSPTRQTERRPSRWIRVGVQYMRAKGWSGEIFTLGHALPHSDSSFVTSALA